MKDDDRYKVGSNLFTNKEFEQRRKKSLTLSRIPAFYKAVDINEQTEDPDKIRRRESRALRKKYRILVVGANMAYCNRMKLMLNENDFMSVTTTIDGFEACSLLKGGKKYDLVISSYRVNRFDGRKIYDFANQQLDYTPGFIMIDQFENHEVRHLRDHGILMIPGKFDEKRNMSVIMAFYLHYLKVFERSHLKPVGG